MNKLFKIVCITVTLALVCCALAACNKEPAEPFDAEAAFNRIMSEVKFADTLEDSSEYTEYTIGSLPEGTTSRVFLSESGAKTDCAMVFTAQSESDLDEVETAVRAYISSLRDEATLYEPEELPKLDKAVFFRNGSALIVVVTDDTATVNSILN